MDKFVIPGGLEFSARLDYARALSRRAERETIKLSVKTNLSSEFLKFLNRLSSALFALVRLANYNKDIKEENPKYA